MHDCETVTVPGLSANSGPCIGFRVAGVLYTRQTSAVEESVSAVIGPGGEKTRRPSGLQAGVGSDKVIVHVGMPKPSVLATDELALVTSVGRSK